jgi:hypothetical protein
LNPLKCNFIFKPHFELNETKLDESIIGKLFPVNCDSVFLKHRIITNRNPFFEIKLGFEPYGVCPLNNEYLCISYPNNGKIDILSKSYELVSSIDRIKGALLNFPRGISTDLNSLVICDSFCHRLIITDTKFDKLIILGKYGTGNSEFYSPFDATFHDNRFLYVCDTGNKRIQKFTSDLAYLRSFKLDYFPIQMIILNNLAIVRDDKNYLYFHYLETFKLKRKSTSKGIAGILGKSVYQIDKNCAYFYDYDANLTSKTKFKSDYEFDKGATCVFNKDVIITSNGKLILVRNLF